jgi:integrase
MSTKKPTRRVGIEERTDANGRKQYRGHAYDRRARRKLRGDWTYSLAAAKSWRKDAVAKLDAGTLSANRGDPISLAAAAFVAEMKAGTARTRSGDAYKPSAIRDYERGFRLRIVPAIGGSRLADVRTSDLQRLVSRWQADDLDASTIRNTTNALRALYRHSVALGRCHHNPTHGLMLPAVRGRRDRIEPPDVAERLVAALDFPERALWATAFEAGLRRGELQAVAWEQIDLDARTIRVHSSWDQYEGPVDPKSEAGWRTVPMTGDLHVILAEHRRRSRRIAGLVFGRTAEVPFAPSTAADRAARAWETANAAAVERAREEGRKLAPTELLVPIGLHEARHTYASYLIAAGVEMKAISTYMGHSSVAFTYDRYGHLLPGSTAENAAKLDAYLARFRKAT